MSSRSLVRHLLFSLLLLLVSGGCKGCFCTNAAKALTETPNEDAIKEEAKKELEKNPKKLSTICGVNVSALKDMVVTFVKSEGTMRHHVRVEGTAVRSTTAFDASADDDDDGADDGDETLDGGDGGGDATRRDASSAATLPSAKPAVTAAAKKDAAASATAVVSAQPILVDPLKTILCIGVVIVTIDPILDGHGNRTGWKSSELEIDSVMTAGVAFTKATTGSGGGHHRRHHHH